MLKKGQITRFLRHPPHGTNVYVQDEVVLTLSPTLTRVWTGHRGVRPPKRHECAATDWRACEIVRIGAKKPNAAAFYRLVEKCMARWAGRQWRVNIVTDAPKF